METIINQHYEATVKRGKITPETSLQDFINKLDEEVAELKIEAEKRMNGKPNRFEMESIDVLGVINNMLKHLGYDVAGLYKMNIQHQQNRKD